MYRIKAKSKYTHLNPNLCLSVFIGGKIRLTDDDRAYLFVPMRCPADSLWSLAYWVVSMILGAGGVSMPSPR